MTMKKFLILLCAVSALLVSCEKPEGPVNNGPVDGPVDNPMDKCEVPAHVRAGGEGTVIWNGFKENAELYIDSEVLGEVQLTIKTITASGITFSVPATTPEGEYMMILIQDGRHELGKIKVLPMQMPITGLDVPENAQQGETVTISGMGFKEGCRIVFESASGEETEMAVNMVNGGIEVTLPEDMPAGKYKISLLQDGLTWLLAENFEVYENLVIKQFSAIRYYAPYISADTQLVMEWKVSREEPVTFTVSQYVIENGVEELNAYDQYVMDASGLITLDHDGFESSNDLEVSYQKNADGQVTVADVLVYGDDQTTPFAWTYDSDGRLLDISSPKRSFRSLEYDGDNLTMFRQIAFEYDEESPANHPCAQDVVWGYMALLEENDPFVYFPYFMGWYTEASAQLPARIVKPSPDGNGTVTLALSYEFDTDGYVSKMSWVEDNKNYAVEYRY